MGQRSGAYRSAKRSKELARLKKQEEKRKRRLARAAGTPVSPEPSQVQPPAGQ